MPILVNYQLKNWRFDLGPEVSFLLNQYYKETVGIFGKENPLIEEQEFELAINAGLRYVLNRWQIGVRYSLDITPFASFGFTDFNGQLLNDDKLDHYHQGLQFFAAYQL